MVTKLQLSTRGSDGTLSQPLQDGMKLYVELGGAVVIDTPDLDANISTINGSTATVGTGDVTVDISTDSESLSIELRFVNGGLDLPNPADEELALYVECESLAGTPEFLKTTLNVNVFHYDYTIPIYLQRNTSNLYPSVSLQLNPWQESWNYTFNSTLPDGASVYIKTTSDVVLSSGTYGQVPNVSGTYKVVVVDDVLGTVEESFSITGKRILPQVTCTVLGALLPSAYVLGQNLVIQSNFDFTQCLKFLFNYYLTGSAEYRAVKTIRLTRTAENYLTGEVIETWGTVNIEDVDQADEIILDPTLSQSVYTISYTSPAALHIVIKTKVEYFDWEDNLMVTENYGNYIHIQAPIIVTVGSADSCSPVTVQSINGNALTVTINKLGLNGVWEEVEVLEFAADDTTAQTSQITEQGVYQFVSVDGVLTYYSYRVVDCEFISCVSAAILNLAQGDFTPCCDDCKHDYTERRFNFSALMTMYETYFALLATSDLVDVYTSAPNTDFLSSLTDIALLLEESYKYCKSCNDLNTDCSGCS